MEYLQNNPFNDINICLEFLKCVILIQYEYTLIADLHLTHQHLLITIAYYMILLSIAPSPFIPGF